MFLGNNSSKIIESAIEDLAIELFEKLGYQYLYAPDIAPDKVNGKARESAMGCSETSGREHFEGVLPLKLMSGVVRVRYDIE